MDANRQKLMHGFGNLMVFAIVLLVGEFVPTLAAEPAVATIGTNTVPIGALRTAVARSGLTMNDPASVRKSLDELIAFETLASEAKRLGYDRHAEVEEQTKRLMVQRLLADKVDKEVDRTPPTEAELKAYYDHHSNEFTTAAMARGQVATLLVKGSKTETIERAQRALDEGKTLKFEDIVKRNADFPNERMNGGDTGWMVSDAPNKRYPAEVMNALLKLEKPGEIAGPVVTDKSVFLVRLTEKRASQISPFEQVKPGLRAAVERDRRKKVYDALCERLKSEQGVKIEESTVKKVIDENKQSATPPPPPFRTP